STSERDRDFHRHRIRDGLKASAGHQQSSCAETSSETSSRHASAEDSQQAQSPSFSTHESVSDLSASPQHASAGREDASSSADDPQSLSNPPIRKDLQRAVAAQTAELEAQLSLLNSDEGTDEASEYEEFEEASEPSVTEHPSPGPIEPEPPAAA